MVGGYRLLGSIGEGGSAVVHLATRLETGATFAVKVSRPEVDGADAVLLNELNNARRVQGSGAGVVRVFEQGRTESGDVFLVLEFMEGGTLAEAIERGDYATPRDALALAGKLASILARAHAHAVLHCDVKPDNVLFDTKGEPHLADFGVAQSLDPSTASRWLTLGGTRGFMSPEQARARSESAAAAPAEVTALTVQSDVFSLGVVLYVLLTRTLPFGDGDDFEGRVQFDEPSPCVPARFWARELEPECAMICRRALRKKPSHRYETAAHFAEDVRRALAGLPLREESSRPIRRTAKWVNRHRVLSLVATLLGLFLLYLPFVPFLLRGQSRAVLAEQNSNAALHQAGAIMNELRDMADSLLEVAAQPDIQALIHHENPLAPAPALARFASPNIDNFIVISDSGWLRARSPVPAPDHRLTDISFRDYFQGAARLGREQRREIYVPRVIRSMTTHRLELELSTPLYDSRGTFIGVVGAARPARSTFGAVQMNCAGTGTCMTGLLAARDRDEAGAPRPDPIIFIAAPELQTGHEVALDLALSRRICERINCVPDPSNQFAARPDVTPVVEDFFDPVSGRELLGAFAPVGGTGLVVLVATPATAVRELTDRMLERARAYLGVPLLMGVVLFGGFLASLHLRRGAPYAGAPLQNSKAAAFATSHGRLLNQFRRARATAPRERATRANAPPPLPKHPKRTSEC